VSASKQDAQAGSTDGLSGHVGEFIRSQRERADLSLRRLAERAGVSNPYLSQVERGLRKPSAEILKRLSRALQISAESLYSRAGLIEDGPVPPPVIDSIEADQALSPRQKQVLIDLYRTLVSAGPRIEGESK
jgi:transcriptional regulator with XRE-family HTH domain